MRLYYLSIFSLLLLGVIYFVGKTKGSVPYFLVHLTP